MKSPDTALTSQDAAALAGSPRPAWKRNIGGVRGAVGYYDSTGSAVVVVNWEAILYGRRARIDVSAPGYGADPTDDETTEELR